ncbi:MAG: TlpA family protein disulfide reductase [Anaerolineae bacterium]
MSTTLNQNTPAPSLDTLPPDSESVTAEPTEGAPKRGLGIGSIVLLVGIVVIGIVFALALARQRLTQPNSGAAPEFTVTTFDGQTFSLSDLRGKVVMINFWASWCGPCRDEAPELQAAWEHYQDNPNVVFLGIAYADNGPRSLAYIDEFGITYLNAPDLGTRISDDYHIQGVPESFIVDQNGNISQFIYAGVTRQGLISMIDQALVEGSAS